MAHNLLVDFCPDLVGLFLSPCAASFRGAELTVERFILPLLGEYADSGFRTPKDRMIYSLRSNGRYQLTVLVCGIIGLGYVLWQNGFRATSVKALVMALAYCWGLIFAIYLMGHGLVAVPRRLYRNASASGRLRRIQSRAPKLNDRLLDATSDLEDLEAQVTKLVQRKNGISRDHQEWIDELSDTSNNTGSRLSAAGSGLNVAAIPAVITDRYLAELARKLNRARHKRVRYIDAWDRLIQEAADMQAILDASASKQLEFGRASPYAPWYEKVTILTPYTRYLLYIKALPTARLALAGILSLASVCVVWSELVKFPAPKLSIISLTVVSHRSTGEEEVGFIGQAIASVWLLYMCLAALASFDEVKIWGNRALVRRNTYGESATWYSGQIAKLTVPLAYNFVTFLPRTVHRETTFYNFLGRLVNITPLGKGFDYFFPILVLIPVCATLFNLYGRVQMVFGFGIIDDDEEGNRSAFDGGGWREGRDLIERELSGTSSLGPFIRGGGNPSPLPSRCQISAGAGSQSGNTAAIPDRFSKIPSSRDTPSRQTETARRQAQILADATQTAEETDENFFQGFAHRIRNTFDTMDKPEWLSDLGKRPKWMGGVNGNSESSGRADSGRGLGRWFGGRPADGHLRL